MLVYYQDFGSTSSYRIQNWPASLGVLRDWIHNGHFPSYGALSAEAAAPAAGRRRRGEITAPRARLLNP